MASVLNFVFPPTLQHPLSTGRLYAFGLYGPLDEHSQLRSGRGGQRVVSGWELDAMCLQFEKEDILQVYISGKRPLCVLSDAQKEEIIAQADKHLKTAKGRGYREQITREEVINLFIELPRDVEGFLSFHDMQRQVRKYRDKTIASFRVIFPPVTTSHPKGRKTAEKGQDGRAIRVRVGNGKSRWRGRFRPEVAPPEMFIKDAGHTPAEMAKHTNELLSTRAFKICDIVDGNNPGLTENVRLIREDVLLPPGQAPWDKFSCVRGMHIGGHLKSARGSTTVKRRAYL
ncbi:unnamed protein product [Discosporangium mesarthrocarpum]